MGLTLVAVGTRRDVYALLALGVGLAAAGHRVRPAIHPVFELEVRAGGLEFAPLGINPQDLLQSPATRAIAGMGGNSLQFLRSVLRAFAEGRGLMGEMLHHIYLACDDAQAIVSSSVAFPAAHAVQSLGVPCVMVAQQPFVPTSRVAAPILPGAGLVRLPAGALQSHYNWLSYLLVEQLLWQPWRRVMNRWRKAELGLPAAPLGGLRSGAPLGPLAVLHGFSPLLSPPPDDWPDWAHVTGYLLADLVPEWNPPQSLERFMAQDAAPVVIGFGSMPLEPDLTRRVREAVAIVGCRAILLEGWGGLGAGGAVRGESGQLRLPSAPHMWLLPRSAAVVHHGGSGTTGAGLRAGIPAVVVPFTGDQLFWAGRLHAFGLSPPANRLPMAHRRVDGRRDRRLLRRCGDSPAGSGLQATGAGRGRRRCSSWTPGALLAPMKRSRSCCLTHNLAGVGSISWPRVPDPPQGIDPPGPRPTARWNHNVAESASLQA